MSRANAAGNLEDLLGLLKEAGLTGMEVFYKDYRPDEIEHLHGLATKFDLLPLGGSDYHGLDNPQQREPGDIPLPKESVDRLLALARDRGVLQRARGPYAS